jgi:regulator of RNase E activity RraA
MWTRRSFLGVSAGAALVSGVQPREPMTVTVSLLADALRGIGRDPTKHALSTDIKPLTGVRGTVFGPAVTTKWEPGPGGAGGEEDAVGRFVFQPIDDAPPGSVWVVASGTDEIVSMFGDLIALAAKRRGMAGAVTDSGLRDVAMMESIGFPVFGRATVPYGPGDVIHPVAANVPVVCGGVEIRPGDFVAADADGAIVVPREHVADLEAKADELLARENGVRRAIEDGAPLRRAYNL